MIGVATTKLVLIGVPENEADIDRCSENEADTDRRSKIERIQAFFGRILQATTTAAKNEADINRRSENDAGIDRRNENDLLLLCFGFFFYNFQNVSKAHLCRRSHCVRMSIYSTSLSFVPT